VSFETIHNYYEELVIRHVVAKCEPGEPNREHLADIVCVALNHLPPRYIRYDVDMAFYLSPEERGEIERKVEAAVNAAIQFVAEHRRNRG
jgi:hypothetical protein